jgi:hypothetical protein
VKSANDTFGRANDNASQNLRRRLANASSTIGPDLPEALGVTKFREEQMRIVLSGRLIATLKIEK